MAKKVFSILVAMVVLFAIFACNDNSDLLKKIDELESTVQSQSDKISELEGKNKEQTDKLSELEEQLAKKEEQNRQLTDKIEELVEQNIESVIQNSVHSGEFTDLEIAYENGWLTRDDIMHIAYYCWHGKVIEGTLNDKSTWHEVDFVPTKQITELSDTTINAIKEAYKNYYEISSEGYVDLRGYYGTYNNCVVITIEYNTGFDNPSVMLYIEIDGIILTYSAGPSYMVWKLI